MLARILRLGLTALAIPLVATATLSPLVADALPIGTVQGKVESTDDGLTHRSPYAPPSGSGLGEQVVVQGVIFEKTLARTSSGGSQRGFFIQDTAATADADPDSSDGIFVYMGGYTSLIGGYVPQVGDEVVITGRVSEYFALTEISSASLVQLVRSGVDLDAELPAFQAGPPDALAEANRYWERREGMRAQVASGSLVIDGRDVFSSTADGEVWVLRGDHALAQRSDPLARRAFRDAHPLDNDAATFDDGNGYRIVLGSMGLKAAANDNTVLIAPARTFDTVTSSPIGGVYFSFGKYQIMVEQQLVLAQGADPSLDAAPEPFDRATAYGLATFNATDLYDRRDDPFDGCDFPGNPGCPGVYPPFAYVPASEAAYQTRLSEIAQQVVGELHAPDVLLVQEVEDQDVCTLSAGTIACGSTDDADGRPDVLQELATVIAGLGGPVYEAACDRDGADDRGIVSGFLYRTDRVELLPAAGDHPVLGSAPAVEYRAAGLAYNTDVQNPKALNAALPDDVDTSTGVEGDDVFTRAPQVGLFRVWREGIGESVFVDLHLVANHFISNPATRVGQRTEQAAYNAAIVKALRDSDPLVRVAVGGDLNVFPRPDDPSSPPSDQLAPLYDELTNLYDVLLAEAPASAYSYVFQGEAETLDQIFLSAPLREELVQFRVAHVNSDFPAAFGDDGARGTSDHDPLLARNSLLPTLDRLEALVRYYDAGGAFTGGSTVKVLLGRLALARKLYAKGELDSYRDQLGAFVTQARVLTPRFITATASAALIRETEVLLTLP